MLEARLQLVVSRDREIALRLDHQEARRHSNFEALLFGVETLFGEFAAELRRVDPLAVLLDPQRRIPNLTHRDKLNIPQAGLRLVPFDPGPCQVGLFRALPERICHRHADRPGREV